MISIKEIYPLFLMLSIVFSNYTYPPFGEVNLHNENISLQSIYLNQSSLSWSSPTFEDPILFANASLLFLSPAVDTRISANNLTTLWWVWAEKHEEEVWEDDSDDGCSDRLIFSDFELSGLINFIFKNITKSINISKELEFNLSTPFSTDELNKANGTDNLTANLTAELNFIYVLEVRECVGFPICGCAPVDIQNIEFKKPLSSQLTYTVEGGSVLFFLSAPVLREQWFKNNHFDNIVSTKRILYRGDVEMNNNNLSWFTFYMFNISEDEYGIWRIVSIKNYSTSNMTALEYAGVITPAPLEHENETFIYINIFNVSYDGIGVNNLRLIVIDHFGNLFVSESEIASRTLSYGGNNSEDGISHNKNEMRKSAADLLYKLMLEPLSLSILGILLIVFLAFNRLKIDN